MRRVGLLAAAVAMLAAPATASASDGATRYSIANDCWMLKAGRYYVSDDFTGGSRSDAARFFLKPTDLGTYLFYLADRTFMDASGNEVRAADAPSRTAEWTVYHGAGNFQIYNLGEYRPMRAVHGDLNVGNGGTGTFDLIPAEGCTPYPEVEVNVTGTPSKGETSFSQVHGALETHLHHFAFEFLGGRVHCGRPWHRYGAPYALVDCPDHQVADGNIAVLDNVLDHGTPTGSHSPYGWPKFDGWPTYSSLTHEQTYYRWIERAWRAGLRLFVDLSVENRVLCELYPLKQNDCNEMNSVRKQIRDVYAFQDYVDAQMGGPGKGFYRIVRNPFQARKVINQGKLAVVLGMEVSEPFDCYLRNNKPQCSRQDIVHDLDELEAKGLRQFELVNKFDNGLTGVTGDGGSTGVLTNGGNFYATGSFWRMDSCENPADADHDPMAVEHHDDDLVGAVIQAYLPPGAAPVYPEGPKCNQNGLTGLGEFTIRELIRRHMMFDPDHMSVLARSQAMSVIEAERYSGVVSSHGWAGDPTYRRVWKAGGVVAPSNSSSVGFLEKYEDLMEVKPNTKYFAGFGFGADQNGFSSQPGPREIKGDALEYPFRSPIDPAVTVHRQQSGTRTFDLNTDGVAHYGMHADWFGDMAAIGADDLIRDMRRGAEAYLQAWERATGIDSVNCRRSGRNLDANGVGDLRLGDRPKQALRRAGQPERRTRVWTYCAQGKGARHGTATATFTDSGTLALVASAVRDANASGIHKGDGEEVLSGMRRIAPGLYAEDAGAATFLFAVEDGSVSAVGTALGSLDDAALRALANRSRLL